MLGLTQTKKQPPRWSLKLPFLQESAWGTDLPCCLHVPAQCRKLRKCKVWTKTYRMSPTNPKSSVLLLDINKGDTWQKGLIVQVRCAAPELESSRRRGKCLHLQMCVSLCGCECKHAHLEGKIFQENHRISTTFFYKEKRCQDLWTNYSLWITLAVKSHTSISRKTFGSVYVNKFKENKQTDKKLWR